MEIQDFPGIIPRYYEMEACSSANYQYFGNWQKLEREEKAMVIAHYYLTKLMESHKSEVVNDKIKKDQKKRSKS